MINQLVQFASESASAEPEGIAALGIDPIAILLQAGTFVILFIVIRKFALDKINQALADRKSTIDEGLINVEQAAKNLADAEVRQEELLARARKEADEVIGKAHSEAGVMLKEAEDRTAEKTAKMIADAHNKIESDVKAAQSKLQNEVKSLVASATEAIIDEKLDAVKDAKLIEKAIKEAS